MSIETEILTKCRPTAVQDRKVHDAASELTEMVLNEARRRHAHIEVMLVGSVAKGTHLKDPDIDLFMLFPESTPLETLKEKGLEIARNVITGREHYAQHPYVRGHFMGFQVDLVPAFKIRDTRMKMSAVDRTPFHTRFINDNLSKEQTDQVRLLKRFMKGIECYGAEAKVQGFSGYLCELLIIRFGGFREVLESATGWTSGQHIELSEHSGEPFREPLTFIDPVDHGRNVASAVSLESLVRFVRASREYMGHPSARFFYPAERKTWRSDRLMKVAGKRLDEMVAISMPKLDLIDDVLYPQLRKSLVAAESLLKRNDFEVEKASVFVQDSRVDLLIELSSSRLQDMRVHKGPPEYSENASEFLEKWRSSGLSEPYIEDGRWFVHVKREFTRADAILRSNIRNLRLGKDVKKLDDISVVSGKTLASKDYMAALTQHFDDRMPWERDE